MASLVVTNTFVAATTIESAKMNTNFDDIETYINNRNAGSATWDNMNATTAVIGALTLTSLNWLPSGTKMPFYQASPPTGWTAVAVNDKFMRVVTSGGTGGTTGGSVAASTSLAHTHTMAHTHDLANHTHSTPAHQHDLEYTTGAAGIGTGLPVYSSGSSGAQLKVGDSGGTTGGQRLPNNRTESSGSGTSGAPSSNTSGAASSATTDSALGAFAYADFCVGTKD